MTLSSPGWDQFASFLGGGKYNMEGRGIQYADSGARQTVSFGYSVDYFTFPLKSYRSDRGLNDSLVYFDLVRGGEYYYLSIAPDLDDEESLVHFRVEHYHWWNHWIDIRFYLTGEDNKGRSLAELGWVTPFRGHAYISPSDSSGYYVPVYLRAYPGGEYEDIEN